MPEHSTHVWAPPPPRPGCPGGRDVWDGEGTAHWACPAGVWAQAPLTPPSPHPRGSLPGASSHLGDLSTLWSSSCGIFRRWISVPTRGTKFISIHFSQAVVSGSSLYCEGKKSAWRKESLNFQRPLLEGDDGTRVLSGRPRCSPAQSASSKHKLQQITHVI